MDKAPDAFRTISEVADDLDIPQHVLRFWETRFTQIKPMKRSGGRRYYRPDDVDLLRGIRRLLYGEGYTIRGVQRILKEQGIKAVQGFSDAPPPARSHVATGDDQHDVLEAEYDEAPEIDLDEGEESELDDAVIDARREPTLQPPQSRVEPMLRAEPERATRPSADSMAAVATREPQRELDTERLRAVLSDLVACRQLLDEALKGG